MKMLINNLFATSANVVKESNLFSSISFSKSPFDLEPSLIFKSSDGRDFSSHFIKIVTHHPTTYLRNLKNFQLTLSGFFFLFQLLSQAILLDPIFKEIKWISQSLHSTNLDFFEIYKNLNSPLLSMIFL